MALPLAYPDSHPHESPRLTPRLFLVQQEDPPYACLKESAIVFCYPGIHLGLPATRPPGQAISLTTIYGPPGVASLGLRR
jgi:hypothetical protein